MSPERCLEEQCAESSCRRRQMNGGPPVRLDIYGIVPFFEDSV